MKSLKWKKWWNDWANFSEIQRQAEKAVDEHDYILYGGAAGGGKSYWLRKYPIKFLIEKCFNEYRLKGVRAGLFCEDYPTLWDRHINRIPYEFPMWLGEYKGQTHEFVLNQKYGGGVIAFRNLDDPSKYMSSEFAMIAVDELTKNKKQTFDFLRMRKRWTGVPRTKFIAGTNPGEIGHVWVKDLWIDKKFDENEQEKDQFVFIPAKATDNKYLDPSYFRTLDSLPENLRKAYRDGNWDIFAGQYFDEWDMQKHVVEPFELQEYWHKFRSYDHGRENPACMGWYAVNGDGQVYKYRELYAKGLNVDQLAEEINRLSAGESYQYSVADPSIFANQGFVDKFGGQTLAETFARYGITFYPASNRRIDGWNIMHQYLRWDDTTEPKLKFFSTCTNSLRTIPALIHSDIRPEDMDTRGEDHAADECRYFLMSLHERLGPKVLTEVEKKIIIMKQKYGE